MKTFGEKKDFDYYDRPGAYIVLKKENKAGVVKIPKGLFLVGGGIEVGETEEQCIRRECLEETGYDVVIKRKIGTAETYTIHSSLGPFHPIQYYYEAQLGEAVCKPVEKDHELIWLAYDELKGKMFSEMQNWALDRAFSE